MNRWIATNVITFIVMLLSALAMGGVDNCTLIGACVVGASLIGTSIALYTHSKLFWIIGQAGNVLLLIVIGAVIFDGFGDLVFVLLALLTINNIRLLMNELFSVRSGERNKVVDVDYHPV